MPSFLPMAAFSLQLQGWEVTTDTVWPGKTTLFLDRAKFAILPPKHGTLSSH